MMGSQSRAIRRRQERENAKTGRKTSPPESRVPGGDFGVEVDCLDDGVLFTLLAGKTVVTAKWTHEDARQIAKMIAAAGDKDEKEALEVVRESGLVIAPKGMQL